MHTPQSQNKELVYQKKFKSSRQEKKNHNKNLQNDHTRHADR